MAFTMTLPTPALGPGSYFVVRYRLLPFGVWQTLSPNPTNAPFTIPGPAGRYEVEARAVISGNPCPTSTYTIDASEPCNCPPGVGADLVRTTSTQTNLRVSFAAIPACGFAVEYGVPGSPMQSTQVYPQVGDTDFQFPVTATEYKVRIYSDCCSGARALCFDQIVHAPDLPVLCKRWDSSPGSTVTLQYVAPTWRLKIVREMPPSPTAPTQCESITLTANQCDNYTPGWGQGNSQNSVMRSLTSADFIHQTNVPNDTAYVVVNPYREAMTEIWYEVLIKDCCGFTAQYLTNKFWAKDRTPK